MFVAIEVLQGHEYGALLHLRGAAAIMESIKSPSTQSLSLVSQGGEGIIPARFTYINTGSSPLFTGDFSDVVTAFTRLSVDERQFFAIPNTFDILPVGCPILQSSFDTVLAAGDALNSMVAAMHSFFRKCGQNFNTLPHHQLPPFVSAVLLQLSRVLREWLLKFSTLPRSSTEATNAVRMDIVMVNYLVARVRLSAYFYRSQTIFDDYLPQFRQIVDLTTTVVDLDNESSFKSRDPCFTPDIQMAQPLYFVARHCRDSALRRQAVEVMKRVGRHGVYTGKTLAKIAEWIMIKEDPLLEEATTCREAPSDQDGPVREEKRLHHIGFDFDYMTRYATIKATRYAVDGTLELILDTLRLA